MSAEAEAINLSISWSGSVYNVTLDPTDTIGNLKRHLSFETEVQPSRQKLMGLKDLKGKPVTNDDTLLSDLQIKPGMKIMMLGSREEDIARAEAMAAQAPDLVDDLDDKGEFEGASLALADRPEVRDKLQRRVRMVQVKEMAEPREGKGCLVLDIDYTLFDLGGTAERPEELARPYLHDFLESCYAYYDIIIWSATSMKWVEVKMRELGVLGSDKWKIVTLLDHQAMLTVTTPEHGTFDCKPLQFIWEKFPGRWGPHNTILIDDLRRNFVCAPRNGLRIRAYRKSHMHRGSDRELDLIRRYLCHVARNGTDVASLRHSKWREYLIEHGLARKRARAEGPTEEELE